MIDRFGLHRINEAEFVSNLAKMGPKFAEPKTVGTVLGKFEDGWRDRELLLPTGHAGQPLTISN